MVYFQIEAAPRPLLTRFLGALAVMACALGAPVSSGVASEADDAATFVKDFTDEAIVRLFDPEKSDAAKVADFRTLLERGFYLEGIGRFVLGKYYRSLDAKQKVDYQEAFEDYLVATYSRRITTYSGDGFTVLGARKRKKDYYVRTTLEGDDGTDINVEWRVRNFDGDWKIVDIIVERLSMVATQRDEFVSVIRRAQGDVGPLLAELREKWETFKAASPASIATN